MCEDCDYEGLMTRIENLIEDGRYHWAMDTLSGIRETVSDKEHATERQMAAIENISGALRD